MRHLNKQLILGAICFFSVTSCSILKNTSDEVVFPGFSTEGHRGARGLYPENSIGAMKLAIDLQNVTTLELDCHITKDKKVVVYHDDYLNPKFVTYNNGKELSNKDNKGLIYDYTFNDLKAFNIGLKGNVDFPQQKKISTNISLLSDLIDTAESYAKSKRKAPMFYNIETKSKAGRDHVSHPAPQEFSDLLLQVVIDKGIAKRTIIQSFDKRTIQYINKTYPQINTSYLVDAKNRQSIDELVDELGFKPFIISPNYKIVTNKMVQDAHKLGIKIIPWTVNTKEEIEMLKKIHVDGIISDYPNLF